MPKKPDTTKVKTYVIAAMCGGIIMVGLVVAGVTLIERFDQTNRRAANNKVVWHGVICSIESAVLKDPKTDAVEKDARLRFYDGLLIHFVKTAPCNLRH